MKLCGKYLQIKVILLFQELVNISNSPLQSMYVWAFDKSLTRWGLYVMGYSRKLKYYK